VSDSDDAPVLNALIDLHARRWQRAGEPGVIQSNRSEAFLRDVASRLARSGSLLTFTLRFEETPVAIILAMRDRTTIFDYLTAFDPAYEKLGVGRELLARALEYTHEQGYRQWDFLRGDEPYKLSWGARRVPKCRVRISA
jgi:CelD/BcsL family acetyltransferase involved in cellulose biosynthesis